MALTAGTPFEVDANGAAAHAVAKLTSTTAIVVYRDNGVSDFECRVVELDETINAADTIEGNPGGSISVAALTATKAIVAWADSTNGTEVGIISISGTTCTFETGSVLGMVNAGSMDSRIRIVAVTTAAAIVTYSDATNQYGAYLTVSGTTITEESDVNAEGFLSSVSMAKLSSTKAIIAYVDEGDSNILKSVVFSVSGTTISAGTPVNLEASDVGDTADQTTALAEISTTQVLCAYANDTDNELEAVVLSVSGTTITVNTPTTVDTWTVTLIAHLALVAFSSTSFALFYDDNMADISVSGTTVTDNGTSTLTTDINSKNEAIAFSATKAICLYEASYKAVTVTAAATTWSYDLIPSAGGNSRDVAAVAADGEYLFFALEDDSTTNQGVFRVERPTSTTPVTTVVYDPGGGSAGNVYSSNDRNKIIFSGNFGTDLGVIHHDIDMGTNPDITPTTIAADVIAPLQVDPGDADHIIAINKTDEDMLETEDNGATWDTLQATLGVQVVAMAMAFFGQYFPFGGFIGGNDGVNEHLAYSPNEFANQREDTSAALQAVGAITAIDVSIDYS